MNKVKVNTIIIYLFTLFNKFTLYISLLPLIYTSFGLTLSQIAMLSIIANAAVFLLEIPTGIVADILGKKQSVVIGSICNCFGLIWVILNPKNYLTFVIWGIIQSLGITLVSGADSALVFEYLRANNSTDNYHKIISTISFVSRISAFISTLLCGWLMDVSFDVLLLFTLLAKVFALLLMLLFIPQSKDVSAKDNHNVVKEYMCDIKTSVSLFNTHSKFSYYLIFSTTLIGAAGIFWEYRSLFIEQKINLNNVQISLLVAILNLILSVSFLFSEKLSNLLKLDKMNLLYLIIPISIAIASVVPNYFSIPIFTIYIVASGIFTPYVNFKLNESIPNDSYRATLLSVSNAVGKIVYMLFLAIFKFIASELSLFQTFFALSFFFIIIYFYVICRKDRD